MSLNEIPKHETASSRRKTHQQGLRTKRANIRERKREALEHPDRVWTRAQWAALNGFSLSTANRILRSGKGPPLVRLSERRVGIRESDNRRWQDERAR
jgi:predicted DNA-binding transcriptional regulator AlpA